MELSGLTIKSNGFVDLNYIIVEIIFFLFFPLWSDSVGLVIFLFAFFVGTEA